MAHYAFLDENNVVTEVITGIDETQLIEGLDTETWYGKFRGQVCKRTSYNGNYRKNYAGIGCTYDEERDAFIAPKPFDSWVLNEETCRWGPPIDAPEDGLSYSWNEKTTSWDLIEYVEDDEGEQLMPIDFPNTPSVNDLYTVGGRTWRWTGSVWKSVTATIVGPTGPTGGAGPTGPEGTFTVYPTAPTGPTFPAPIEGDVWFDSTTGEQFFYYDGYWVESSDAVAGATGPQGPIGPTGPFPPVTFSTTGPTGGNDGDLWFRYDA